VVEGIESDGHVGCRAPSARTTTLGIVPGAAVPLIASATLVLLAVLIANMRALMPGRRAARQSVRRLMLDR
jgi:hypothetical protein